VIALHAQRNAVEPEPLVSVIIPVYQGEAFIEGAVRSALGQTHRALEVLVVDDGSTDGTLARLATIVDGRLRILRQRNAGTAAARNAALACANGKYIAFLDSDDRWFPEKIATEVAVLEDAPEPIGIAYSSHYAVDDDGRLLHLAPVRSHRGRAFDLLLDGEDFLMPSLCLFDRHVFSAIGTFDASRYHEDHEFILRATRRFPIYPTSQRLAVYRQTIGGKSRKILADYERALEAELALVREFGPSLEPAQAARLRENVVRSLYMRFLMYGYGNNARRLRKDVGFDRWPAGAKGMLGRLFAATGVNLMAPARIVVQRLHRVGRQRWWEQRLGQANLDLLYA
jgi:glycosyltransferase involved in cell wall biosynthesis